MQQSRDPNFGYGGRENVTKLGHLFSARITTTLQANLCITTSDIPIGLLLVSTMMRLNKD